MNEQELRIAQFNFFCVLIDELTKALVAKKGKITPEDVSYMWNIAKKQLENNVNITEQYYYSYQILNYQTISVHSNDIELLQEKIKSTKYKLQALAAEYDHLDQKKKVLVKELCEEMEQLYIIKGLKLNTIGREVLDYLADLGILVGHSIYESIDTKYKNENALTFIKSLGFPDGKDESINTTPEDRIINTLDTIEKELESLPDSRKSKILEKVEERLKDKVTRKHKEDHGIHQAEPPKDMQGETDFSIVVGKTAQWFEDAGEHFRKIQKEIEIYKPSNPERSEELAKQWNMYINHLIIAEVLDPFFIQETSAESDRKWTTSVFHWIGIIKNRIDQSKHGAGKMAENYITNPVTGGLVYRKGKPVKRSITRERVGDFERPIVDLAEKMIGANVGMVSLHDWLEEDQGGHRRYRKDALHEYFSDASIGSIKSGNEDYPQYMREYKKKLVEKYDPPTQTRRTMFTMWQDKS